MPDEPKLIYLEPDDEITSLVRRLRAAESDSVVIVAPGRSRATSSAVALRLLAQVAAEEKRSLVLVADPGTRALAGEAGIPAFASLGEATSGAEAPDQGAAAPRAPIHVVRGLPASAGVVAVDRALPAAARTGPRDETVAVRLRKPPPTGGSARFAGRDLVRRRWPWLAALLVAVLIAAAALLPGATVRIAAASETVGPKSYTVQLPVAGHQAGDLNVKRSGTATGTRVQKVPAAGTVTFSNWNTVAVEVPAGTHVSVGGTTAFVTTLRIVVQRGKFGGPPGERSVEVVAVEGGPGGNVAAGAIDTIDDAGVRTYLRGLPDNPNRLVINDAATAGGIDTPHTVIQQSDVDAVVTAIKGDLAAKLAAALSGQPARLYADAAASETPAIAIAPGLVGTQDTATFELTGTLHFDRAYVARAAVEQAASNALTPDIPSGKSLVRNSIRVEIGTATAIAEQMSIQASVSAAAAAPIDTARVRELVTGMTVKEAQDALSDIGSVEVDLWPPWVDRLPRLSLRISVEQVAPSAGPSASPAATASAIPSASQ
jgi:hypothetical protein